MSYEDRVSKIGDEN